MNKKQFIERVGKELKLPGLYKPYMQVTLGNGMDYEGAIRFLQALQEPRPIETVINPAYQTIELVADEITSGPRWSDVDGSLIKCVKLADRTARFWTEPVLRRNLLYGYAIGDMGQYMMELSERWMKRSQDKALPYKWALESVGFLLLYQINTLSPEKVDSSKLELQPVEATKRTLIERLGVDVTKLKDR